MNVKQRDVVIGAGLLLLIIGLWLIKPCIALIFAGSILVFVGMVRENKKENG